MDETAHYLKRASLTWETLRIPYNLVLVVLACSGALKRDDVHYGGEYPSAVVMFFLVANSFYCLGPLLEIYFWCIFGWQIGRVRYVLFAAGIVVSIGVVLWTQ